MTPPACVISCSEAWLGLLTMPLPSDLLKKVLVQLHSTVMPHMPNPLLLSDYLTRCLDEGGLVGMLALNGIFTLVTKHGLEYPNFYSRLYALLQVCIFMILAQINVRTVPDVVFVTCQNLQTIAATCTFNCRLALTVSVFFLQGREEYFTACRWLHYGCVVLGLLSFAQTGCHQRCLHLPKQHAQSNTSQFIQSRSAVLLQMPFSQNITAATVTVTVT